MSQRFTQFLFVSAIALVNCTQLQATNKFISHPVTTVSVQSVSLTPAASPEDVVRALYKTHDAGRSPFFQNKDRALVNRFFVKELADLIWDDAIIATQTGDESLLSGDPLYDAQTMQIKNFVVHAAEIDGDQAEVAVTFTNSGTKQELTYLLEKENGQWLISDILYGDDQQLFEILSDEREEKETP